jgi:hypothetical protein
VAALATPDWLQRPGAAEAGRRWRVLQRIYYELTAMELPEVMPPRERRTVDCVLQRRGDPRLPAYRGGGLRLPRVVARL